MALSKITPFLWFDSQAEEAAKFYVGIFPNSKIGKVTRYSGAGRAPAGSVMTVEFTLDGLRFVALNGGPMFQFTEAISFDVACETQDEIDYYWNKLTADGGQPVRCGWLKDKFGLTWQIVPTALHKMTGGPDPARAKKAVEAMFKMIKLDIAELQKAYDS